MELRQKEIHVSRTHSDCHGRVDISGVSAEKKRK